MEDELYNVARQWGGGAQGPLGQVRTRDGAMMQASSPEYIFVQVHAPFTHFMSPIAALGTAGTHEAEALHI